MKPAIPVAIFGLGLFLGPVAAAEPDPAAACDLAAIKAEQESGVPPGVLAAVGTVESGRASVRGAPFAPWPWTINAGGRGFHFNSKEEAIAATVAYWRAGVAFIDIGCFQVDLAFHGDRFATLDEAFDPERNAQEAARILVRGRSSPNDWPGAVARYHSASPARGGAYLNQVRAVYPGSRVRLWSTALAAESPGPYAIKLSPEGQIVRVLAPSATAAPAAPPQAPVVGPVVGPELRHVRAPQIVYLGRREALPVVVQAKPVQLAAGR